MLTLNGFSAWITIDGEIAKEYGIEVEGNKVTCWIPSETGKTFEVHMKDDAYTSPTEGRVRVDGRNCSTKAIRSGEHAHKRVKGYRTSPTTVSPFVFSKLKVTDNQELISSTHSNPGVIDVKIIRATVFKSRRNDMPYTKTRALPAETVYDEKAKKGLDHGVGFGPAIVGRTVKKIQSKSYGKSVAKFCFHYTSLDMIRAKGIAVIDDTPRPRSSTMSTGIGSLVEGDSEEMRHHRSKSKPRVKTERKTIKSELVPVSGEIIDLTI